MTPRNITSTLIVTLSAITCLCAFSALSFGQNSSWKTTKDREAEERAVMTLALEAEDERNATKLLKYLDSESRSPIIQERITLAWGRIGDKYFPHPPIFLARQLLNPYSVYDERVRAMSAFAIGEAEELGLYDSLLNVLRRENDSIVVRGRAAEALGKWLEFVLK